MRTPFKTLTVGQVLATAAMAGCSSTTGSSGAVQNAATAPASSSASAAASSAASTAPAPSPDPVTPTAEPTGAPSSPVASPADSSSVSDSPTGPALGGIVPNNDVCDADLAYSCGDIGASGVGTVFYASTTPFACGANMSSTCNYLEVAPNLWNPDSKISCKAATGTSCGGSVQETSDFSSTGLGFPWCTGSGGTASIDQEFHNSDIGTGFANTTVMLPVCNPGDAGNVARSYTGGGLTDWSLASALEINALYYYSDRATIGGFNSGQYWGSQSNQTTAWYQQFNNALEFSNGGKYATIGVRPVRAF